MEYILKKDDNIIYFYNVEVDKEELAKILEQLKCFSYDCFGQGQTAGEVTRFPATKDNIYKRIIALHRRDYNTIYKNSIVRHTENNCDYVTYEYSYNKLPDLYDYIDLLINDRDILLETRLFGNVNGRLDMFYVAAHKYQCIIDGLLNYIDSYELKDINSYNKENDNFENYYYQEFNHIELMRLYKEALSHIKFELVAKKETVKEKEITDGYTYALRRVKHK